MQDTAAFEPDATQRAAMESDGFLVTRGFFSAEETSDILAWTEELAAAPEISGRQWVYHEDSLTEPGRRLVQRIENFCPFHEGFDRLVRKGALPRWVGRLMGGPALLFKEKINFKMPGGPGFKLHQDQQAGWTRYAPLFVTAMVTIDPTTIENGCLEIAAGHHREGLLGEEWRPMAEDALPLRAIPTEPGDVIFFDSFVPHASKPNYTAQARRVLYLTYNLAKYGDQRARYYADKHASFPPDIDRDGTQSYVFRV
ncbi:MAG: phytanoyl-CoA dioxygenase family protein [Hyphomicrobiales bacterium]|nr:phytanoyl-CoA dioxygenase family protein [Hyphomicrobiales bacterium]